MVLATPPWLIIRQAHEALKNARPEDAHRLLQPLVEQGHKRAYAVQRIVMRGFIERAARRLRNDDSEAAWADLLLAERIDHVEPGALQLRETLTRLGLAELRALLETGKPLPAVEVAVRLRDRGVRNPELTQLTEAAQDWVLANEIADRGDFLLAEQSIERVRRNLTCPTTGLDRWQENLSERQTRFRQAIGSMRDAVESANWPLVLEWSEQAVAATPQNRDVQQMRNRAWQMLQLPPQLTNPMQTTDPGSGPGMITPATGVTVAQSLIAVPPLKRFYLWIDGVAGYLVCLNSRISLGQATGDGPIDVPLFADVSRLHACLTRDEEGYLLEASKAVQVNGHSVERALLNSGDRLTLGGSCQFLFTRPLAISATAKMNLVSGHRLPTSVDGVLLMADTLILGPEGKSHVTIPGLNVPLILMRGREGISVRHAAGYRVDGTQKRDRTELTLPAHVYGEDFSMTIEPANGRMAAS